MTEFDQLFRKYHRRLLLFTLKFVDSESDALDIVQNVFVAIWENGKFRQSEDAVQAYLFNSVKNCCLNYIKHQKVIRKFENETSLQLREMEALHYQSGEKSLIETENLQQINSAIDSLPEIYKEVIVLSRFEGLKNSEIAEKLNLPVRTIETRVFRALAALKEKISQKSFFMLLCMSRLKR
ncbi:MAG TPA: RNA polymerase sigma-70 factor [Prolixibacteraceae bacterium]|jgi:RNA polymerase sigma-70 factor (ECF subfamily)|nr:RNA polymerase sigma-70 factor [Prolixibacteraceae bacterium]